jgi:hypothetical protein
MLNKIDACAIDRRPRQLFQFFSYYSNFNELLCQPSFWMCEGLAFEVLCHFEIILILGIVGLADRANKANDLCDAPCVCLILNYFVSVPEYDPVCEPMSQLATMSLRF